MNDSINNSQRNLIFVTTNSQKFKDIKLDIESLDNSINLEQAPLDLLEPQSLNLEEVAIFKAKEAWKLVQKPLIIDDGGIFIEQYNKFPGTLSKYVFQGIGLEGIWKLAQDDPRAYFTSCIVYIDASDNFKVFSAITRGTLVKPKSELQNKEMPYREIFIPEGSDKIYSEITDLKERHKYSHRHKALKELVKWLNCD